MLARYFPFGENDSKHSGIGCSDSNAIWRGLKLEPSALISARPDPLWKLSTLQKAIYFPSKAGDGVLDGAIVCFGAMVADGTSEGVPDEVVVCVGTMAADGMAESVTATIVAILSVSLVGVDIGAWLPQDVRENIKNITGIRIDGYFTFPSLHF